VETAVKASEHSHACAMSATNKRGWWSPVKTELAGLASSKNSVHDHKGLLAKSPAADQKARPNAPSPEAPRRARRENGQAAPKCIGRVSFVSASRQELRGFQVRPQQKAALN